MKRIVLFLATNLAVVVVLSFFLNIALRVFNVDPSGISGLLLMAAIFGMGGSFISLCISKWIALRATGAEIIKNPTNETERWLIETVQRQARAVGIGMPDVAIYPAHEFNAFATGMNKNHALVAVSHGLLQRMNRDEIEGVLGHEISHIANGDMITLTLIQGVINTVVILLSRIIGQLVDQALSGRREEHGGASTGMGGFIATMVAQIVLGFLASLIVLWFSRQREFRADAGSASVAGRDKMVAALKRLNMATQSQSENALPKELAAFGISGQKRWLTLFMSHPPLEERIKRLMQIKTRV